MTPDMMCITDLDGRKLQGDRDPSSEMLMHLEVYRSGRMHARSAMRIRRSPPASPWPAFPLDRAVLAEVLTTLGSIPIAEYATPSTAELPEAVRKYVKAHDGMLLANHGALTLGTDVLSAYYKMETIEHFAKISLVARMLGGENLIARDEVDRLQGLRDQLRHQGAGTDLPGPDGPRRPAVRSRPDDMSGGAGARGRRSKPAGAGPDCAGPDGSCRTACCARWGRGNSVNIPRTLRAHRRRHQEPQMSRALQISECRFQIESNLRRGISDLQCEF